MWSKHITINDDNIDDIISKLNSATLETLRITVDHTTISFNLNKELLTTILYRDFMGFTFLPHYTFKNDETKTAGDNLVKLVNLYLSTNNRNYASILYSGTLEYSPIENYDKYSDIHVIEDGTVILTPTGSTATLIDNGKEHETTTESDKTMENVDMIETVTTDITRDRVTNSTTTSFTNRKDTTKNDNDIQTVEHTHGNIGVVDNVTLLEKELAYRLNNLMEIIIYDVLKKFLFICEV